MCTIRATILLLLFIIGPATHAQSGGKAAESPQFWQKQPINSHIPDTVPLYKLLKELDKGETKIHSFLLVRKGDLILEKYYQNHDRNTIHDLRSTSKSIRALLMGIALDKGIVKSLDEPVLNYLQDLRPQSNLDLRKEQITLRHLLTMSSGLECNDWDPKSKGQEDRVYKKKDWLQYTLDLPVANNPGEVSAYCSMGAIMIAEVIQRASGMTIQDFAQQYLFDPLDIKEVKWGHTANKEVLDAGKRLYMTPRDMAKLGQLVLQKGQWKGRQIISEEWMEEATTPKTKITGIDYGYFWWNLPFQGKEQQHIAKLATGNGGQYIMVFPDLGLVAVFTGGAYNSPEDKLPFAIMNRVILPALKE